MVKLFDSREFKYWHYNISHGELLIRSCKNSENTKNIDIVFFDVIYVELPRNISNLILKEAKEDDVLYVEQRIEKTVNIENITI